MSPQRTRFGRCAICRRLPDQKTSTDVLKIGLHGYGGCGSQCPNSVPHSGAEPCRGSSRSLVDIDADGVNCA